VLFYITHTKNILQPTKALYNIQIETSIRLILVSALGCHPEPSSESIKSKDYKPSLGFTLPLLACVQCWNSDVYKKLISIKITALWYQNYMTVSSSKYQSTVVYYTAVYCTAWHNKHHHEIPADHVRTIQIFVGRICIECKQLWTYTWNCSLSYNFNITIL